MRKRKTLDTWELQGNYGHGWELLTTSLTFAEARQDKREYRENEPATPTRIRYKREKINQ